MNENEKSRKNIYYVMKSALFNRNYCKVDIVSGWPLIPTQRGGPPPPTWRSSLPRTEPWTEDKQHYGIR